jgi:hypothetical protein
MSWAQFEGRKSNERMSENQSLRRYDHFRVGYGIHASGQPIILVHPRKHISNHFSVNIDAVLLEAKSLGRLYAKSFFLSSERYHRLLEDEPPFLLDVPLHIRRELRLKQNGVPTHSDRQTTAFFNDHFQNRWNGHLGHLT